MAKPRSTCFVAGCMIGLSTLFVFIPAIRPRQNHGPSLSLSADVCELGSTSLRKEWHVPFQVSNTGTGRLVINEIDAACKCGVPVGETIIISPGETVEITLTADARFKPGLVETKSSFTTNDPAQPLFELTVRVLVLAEVPANFPTEQQQLISVLVEE